MNIVLIIVAFILLGIGIVGSVAPGLPGPPISWVGLLLAKLSTFVPVSSTVLVVTAVAAGIITVLDYVVPSASTKRFGGSKAGIWGCNIGLVISIFGLPFGPQGLMGVVFWPFIGAFVGEYLNKHDLQSALKAAWGAFIGFLSGTLMKVVYCVALMVVVVIKLF